jgi:probable rRNA maturation factor
MKINIFTENTYAGWDIDERKFLDAAQRLIQYYLAHVKSCLTGIKCDMVAFDILYCDSKKTHEINREYRGKDYPADIITFAIFADSQEKFVLDGEVNLGEIIIALDKVKEEAAKKGVTPDEELIFLLAHGILHLLGFEHDDEQAYNQVIKLQDEAIRKI